MVAIVRSLPLAAAGRPEPVHYQVYYSSVMQVRFGHLSKLTVFAVFVLNALVSLLQRSILRIFAPITVGLGFAALFFVYGIRKARLHVENTVKSSLATEIYSRLIHINFVRAFIVYGISCCLLAYIYYGKFTNLSIFLPKQEFELTKLNEKRIYLNSLSIFTFLIYITLHLAQDQDRIMLAKVKANPMSKVQKAFVPAIKKSALCAVATSICFVPVYMFFRGSIWRSSLSFARMFTTLHRSSALGPFPIAPFHSLLLTFYLNFLWNIGNDLFTIYMSVGALHRGKCISSKSNDPNGTLISGLRVSKRRFARAAAFQELSYIASSDGRRRELIYIDTEKPTAWQQILTECLLVLQDLRTRFQTAQGSKDAKQSKLKQTVPQPDPFTSPTPAPLKVRKENVFLSRGTKPAGPVKNEHRVLDSLQDPKATQSSWVIEKLATGGSYFQIVKSKVAVYAVTFLRSPLGVPFRCTVQRRVSMLINNPDLVSSAIFGLSNLVVNSMSEDTFGTVQRDIPRVLEELDKTLTVLEEFYEQPILHWSDVDNIERLQDGMNPMGEQDSIKLEEIDQISENLLEAFEGIYKKFNDYLSSMSVSADVYRRGSTISKISKRYI
ncbi:nucleoporin protein Ndc1-Nup [Lipomyces arxii]|uniref:nucleoporin protein Ndc1-Nup n=1 Tax=Lipomyces arxii TaxID=56418 RepID=UPI0034CDC0BE